MTAGDGSRADASSLADIGSGWRDRRTGVERGAVPLRLGRVVAGEDRVGRTTVEVIDIKGATALVMEYREAEEQPWLKQSLQP